MAAAIPGGRGKVCGIVRQRRRCVKKKHTISSSAVAELETPNLPARREQAATDHLRRSTVRI